MPEIERLSPQFDECVDGEAEIEWLGDGYGGTDDDGVFLGVAEGPVWFHDENHLVFSDNGRGNRYGWSEGEGVTLLRAETNNANGLARDPQGRLVACEHATRRVTREEPDGSITVVADNYRGQRLNRPNDVVVTADGAIYFTDPMTFGVDTELDLAGVFRVSPDLRTINLILRDFAFPNGLCFSLDETTLYVNDMARMHIRAFAMDTWGAAGARPALASDRVLCQMSGERHGAPDGMKVDSAGRIWCTGPGGIWVIDPSGEHLGTIVIDGEDVTNFCFGGTTMDTIFFTTYTRLGRFRVKATGPKLPRSSQ